MYSRLSVKTEMTMSPNSGISVAMCTYNGERYLREQLESIANQTMLPSEIVICDDGSVDATPVIVADFALSAPFKVQFIRNSTNLGSTKNFEQAIELCDGKLIALCDQDDIWRPEKLAVLAAALRDSGAGGVFSNGLLMDEESRVIGGSLWGANHFDCKREGFNSDTKGAISDLLKRNVVTGATLMFRSDLRGLILPVPKEWIHDGWLAWMLVLHSRLLGVAEPLILYRVHASQQVGVLNRSLSARLLRARETGMHDYCLIERQFGLLFEYAQSHAEACEPELCRRIDAKRRHAAFRAQLNGNRLRRWVEITNQFFAYRAYSQGWQSMLKDALV
jgi:glycosyltransferase involved in cell wall biosynthesis